MPHIFSFIHRSSTQIMSQICFEIQNCNAKLLKIHYNIIASFKKENAHPHPSPSHRGQGRFSEFWVSVAHRDPWVWLSSEK